MMDSRARELIQQGDRLFEKRSRLMSLWQEQAENFYPERASFTVEYQDGKDFAANLMSSYPLLARRDLGNAVGAMLRPPQKDWMRMGINGEPDHEGRAWLEMATGVQKRAMYDRRSRFTQATKEADHDFVCFGQAVIQATMNRNLDGLMHRTWHLRDVAWCDNADGAVDAVHRRWRPTAQQLNQYFRGNIAPALKSKIDKDPYCEVNCRHVVVSAESYGAQKYRAPFVSLYVDADNEFVMEEVGAWSLEYVIPRWQRADGGQYALSPATVCALPDARLIQSMTLTLLEAGEKAVSPPMIAVQEAVRSDIALYAGAVTWVDREYDERLGEVLRPLTQDKSGLPFGMEMRNDLRESILEAFYLNKLNLPPMGGPEMTAYEVGQRVQEYIRQALPLFEPMEDEYNAALCERDFDLLLRNGAFGPPENIPRSLRGAEIVFRFESPLRDATDKQKVTVFAQVAQMLSQAVALDPSAGAVVDSVTALRDALQAIAPTSWTRSPEAVQAIKDAQAAQAQQQQILAALGQSSEIAKNLGQSGALQ